jgi:DNA-binding NtrC family response regulator
MSDSPEDSLELARQIKFSLIVIDTALRSISAMTIFLELKKISPDSITILFTEAKKESIEIAKEAVRQNAYTYIEKPVNIDKLLSTLDTIKQQQRSNFVQKPGDAYGNNFK